MRTQDGVPESTLYENIVSIPHYSAKTMHSLVDKEDEREVVNDNYSKFQQIYHPIWQEQFRDCFAIVDGKFEIKHDDATRRELMRHVNDNVFQNINSKTLSLRSYDQDKKFHKIELEDSKKAEIIEAVLAESKAESHPVEHQNKEFATAIDKVLIAHRNTKFFLFIMSW